MKNRLVKSVERIALSTALLASGGALATRAAAQAASQQSQLALTHLFSYKPESAQTLAAEAAEDTITHGVDRVARSMAEDFAGHDNQVRHLGSMIKRVVSLPVPESPSTTGGATPDQAGYQLTYLAPVAHPNRPTYLSETTTDQEGLTSTLTFSDNLNGWKMVGEYPGNAGEEIVVAAVRPTKGELNLAAFNGAYASIAAQEAQLVVSAAAEDSSSVPVLGPVDN